TAFLDNSGGVDTSDHEVNIKILYAPLLAAETITRAQRNAVLVEVEGEVVEMVLANNRSQSRMVSYDVRRSNADLWRYARTMELLVAAVPFDPDKFAMPNDDELANRHRRNEGLFKCEAAVLGSHAKMLAYRELLEDEPLPERMAAELTRDYFPARVRELAGDEAVANHLLFREIATTMAVNRIVDNAGCSLFIEMATVTCRSYRDVAGADLQGLEVSGADQMPGRLPEHVGQHR